MPAYQPSKYCAKADLDISTRPVSQQAPPTAEQGERTVADLDLQRRELVDALLVGEVAYSIRRTFAHGPQAVVGRFGGWLPACPGLAGAAGHTDPPAGRRKFGCRDCCDCCDMCGDCCDCCSCL